MKATFIRKTGGPEVIEWGDLPKPHIKDNEVLVKVSAVAADQIDTYIRAGKFPMEPPFTFPYIIGGNFIGTVEEIGKKVKKFKKGDKVWSHAQGLHGRQGSFAEYVPVNEQLLFHAVDGYDDKDIVAVLQAGITAVIGLVQVAMLKATDTIFVNGGAGNIGSAIIQLAKARGATVYVSTKGKEKIEWCKNLGADLVLDYSKDDIAKEVKKAAPQGVAAFWDTSRMPNFDLAVDILAKQGRIVLMAGAEARPPFPVGPFYRKECMMKGFSVPEASVMDLQQSAELVNMALKLGALKSKIAQVLPMSEAAKAHQLLESKSEIWGKIVLTL